MSYILDALKKSEQARLAAAAAPQQPLLGIDIAAQPRPVWPYWVIAVLLLNAAALYFWPRNPGTGEFRTEASPVVTPAPTAPAPPRARADGEAQVTTLPVTRSPLSAPAAPAASAAPAVAPAAPAPREAAPQTAPAVPATRGNDAVARVSRPGSATSPAAGEAPPAAPLAPGEMPAEVRRELPPLAISGVMRVQDAASLVVVNERPVREGEEAAPGVRVERILENGVQFSYKGYRFQR